MTQKDHVGYFVEIQEGIGWQLEANMLIQVRDDGGLDQGGESGKRSDSGWNWELELTFRVSFAHGKVLERNTFSLCLQLAWSIRPCGPVGLFRVRAH